MRDTLRKATAPVLRILAGVAMLLAVVAVNGRPVVFADANIYYWMGEMEMRPVRYALSPWLGGPSSAATDPETADEVPSEMQLRRTEMAARSPWFGVTLYLIESLGGLWLYAGVQALAASFTVHALWRAVAPKAGNGAWLGLMAALSVGSTLPFFVGFSMPDLWAGTALCALAALAFYRDRIAAASQAALALVLLAGVAFHKTNSLVAAAALAAAFPLSALLRSPTGRLAPAAGVLAACMALTFALNGAYVGAIRAATGETIRSPPFLAARVLADGPGRDYLKAACARGEPWALCRFARLPLNDSQDILWSGDPHKGVFGLASAAERIRIDNEQNRFVLSVIRAYPLEVLRVSMLNFVRELSLVQLDDPLRDPHFYLTDPDWRDTYIADMVHRMSPCDPQERGCKPRFTSSQSALWHGSLFALSGAFLLWRASRRDIRSALFPRTGAARDEEVTRLLLLILFVIAATVINAGVTGVLSGTFARYQSRIAWLTPLAALLLAGAVGWRAKAVGPDPERV